MARSLIKYVTGKANIYESISRRKNKKRCSAAALKGRDWNAIVQVFHECHPCRHCEVHTMRLIHVVLQSFSLLSIGFAPVLADTPCDANCLSSGVATALVNNFLSLIANFNVDAANALAPNVVDMSDSINYLTGAPLGSSTSRLWPEPPQAGIPISLINIDAVTCEGTIAFRWVAYPGSRDLEVRGIDVLYTANGGDKNKIGPGGWQITHVFSEFNTAAWIESLGVPCRRP